jgi:Ca2+/H+ antiporter
VYIVNAIKPEISQYDGVLLIAGLIAFTIYTLSRAKKERKQEEDPSTQKSSVPRALGLVAVGSGLLYFGGLLTIENVISIAQGIGISETVIGITIVAIGTSLPELITSNTKLPYFSRLIHSTARHHTQQVYSKSISYLHGFRMFMDNSREFRVFMDNSG